MLGYLAQVDYALVRAVECLLDGEVNLSLSIELEDDFSLKAPDSPSVEWWQTKHSVDSARTISDSDPEFWKALSAWLRHGRSNQPTKCYFLTTATPAAGSAYLLLGASGRSEKAAVKRLDQALEQSQSQTLKKHAEPWERLSGAGRANFLKNVEIVHSAPQADAIDEVLLKKLRPFFGPRYNSAGASVVRGWWAKRVREHLIGFWSDSPDAIDLLELEETIDGARARLREDDLPVTYDLDGVVLPDEEANFVKQLRLIALHDHRIALCIQEHNRAFLSRSFWQRESLLRVGELPIYDQRLKDAWMKHFLPDAAAPATPEQAATEDEVCDDARTRFRKLEDSGLPQIRAGVREEFIATGSLHILADRLELGWHPEWVERLGAVLAGADSGEVVA